MSQPLPLVFLETKVLLDDFTPGVPCLSEIPTVVLELIQFEWKWSSQKAENAQAYYFEWPFSFLWYVSLLPI